MSYAVVLDASSSLREPAHREEVERSYASVIRVLIGVLCQGEKLWVYTFPAGSDTPLVAVDIVHPTFDPNLRALEAAGKALDRANRHSDLALVVEVIDTTLFDSTRHTRADAVFLLTDGSFYPAVSGPVTRTYLNARLADLALRASKSRVFVIGVRSDSALAIDPALVITGKDQGSTRGLIALADLEVDTARGSTLLSHVFGQRFRASDDFSLIPLILTGNQALWPEQREYISATGLRRDDLGPIAMQHLLFFPHALDCSYQDNRESIVERVVGGPRGDFFCSIQQPSIKTVWEIINDSSNVIWGFRQDSLANLDAIRSEIYHPHQLMVSDTSSRCSDSDGQQPFIRGESWPPAPGANQTGEVRLVGDTIYQWPLLQIPRSTCSIPGFDLRAPLLNPGSYTAYVQIGERSNLRFVKVKPQILAQAPLVRFRRGGFPFPPKELALVKVCVEFATPPPGGEKVTLNLGSQSIPLTLTGARRGCLTKHPRGRNVFYGSAGLVALPNDALATGYVVVGLPGDSLVRNQSTQWYPVALNKDGRFLLQWHWFIWSFAIGSFIQLFYWMVNVWRMDPPRNLLHRLFTLRTFENLILSGVVCVLCAQFLSAMIETRVSDVRVPLMLSFSVFVYIAKVVAASVLPELVEETVLG